MAWVAASALVALAAVGTVAWSARAPMADGLALTPPEPASPAHAATSQAVPVPAVDPVLPQTSPDNGVVQASPPAPASTPAGASPKAAAATAVPGAGGTYTIMVASFKRAETAERVVEELTNAGFGARVVERDGGPERGRFMLVMISGYTSAIDVQRDLQRIRALPGGYADARIVEHE